MPGPQHLSMDARSVAGALCLSSRAPGRPPLPPPRPPASAAARPVQVAGCGCGAGPGGAGSDGQRHAGGGPARRRRRHLPAPGTHILGGWHSGSADEGSALKDCEDARAKWLRWRAQMAARAPFGQKAGRPCGARAPLPAPQRRRLRLSAALLARSLYSKVEKVTSLLDAWSAHRARAPRAPRCVNAKAFLPREFLCS